MRKEDCKKEFACLRDAREAKKLVTERFLRTLSYIIVSQTLDKHYRSSDYSPRWTSELRKDYLHLWRTKDRLKITNFHIVSRDGSFHRFRAVNFAIIASHLTLSISWSSATILNTPNTSRFQCPSTQHRLL